LSLDSRTGWWAVGTTFVALGVAFGFSYNFGSVVAPMRESLGISASRAGWIFSVLPFTFLALSGVTGRLADRWGPRPMLANMFTSRTDPDPSPPAYHAFRSEQSLQLPFAAQSAENVQRLRAGHHSRRWQGTRPQADVLRRASGTVLQRQLIATVDVGRVGRWRPGARCASRGSRERLPRVSHRCLARLIGAAVVVMIIRWHVTCGVSSCPRR
jgi:hypothetical protein